MKNSFTPKIGIIAIVLLLIISAVLLVSKRNEPTSLTSEASVSPSVGPKKYGGEIGEYYTGPSQPPVATTAAAQKPADIKTYIYTGAKTVSSTNTKLELESTGSAEAVTAWYKKKVEEGNFNAKSFGQTNTNGNILSKLTAAKPGEKLDITIKTDQTTSKVRITVDRS